MTKTKCKNCKVVFKDFSSCARKYCSLKCFYTACRKGEATTRPNRKPISELKQYKKAKCYNCKENFFYDKYSSTGKYCSMDCYRKKTFKGWEKGKKHSSQGYVLIKKPNHPSANSQGYVFEHRLVIERKLKRYLKDTEVIHHINENKEDNRPVNLKLFKNANEHIKYHRLNVNK